MSRLPEVANDTFVALVRDLGRGPIRSVRVIGQVDFSSAEFAENLVFRDVDFDGSVMASGARFKGGLEFIGCRFRQGVDLGSSRVDGNLVFSKCMIESGAGGDGAWAVGLRRTVVAGDVSFDSDTTVTDRIIADLLQVRGHLRIASPQIGSDTRRDVDGGWNAPVLDLDGAVIGGSVVLDATRGRSGSLRSSFGSGRRPPQYFGRIDLKLARIGGHLELGAAAVSGDVVGSGARIGGAVFTGWSSLAKLRDPLARRVTRESDAPGSGAQPPRHHPGNTFATGGGLLLEAAEVRGVIDLSGAELGLFQPKDNTGEVLNLGRARCAGVAADGLLARGAVNLGSLHARTDVALTDSADRPLDIAAGLSIDFAETTALFVMGGRIGGRLSLMGLRCSYIARVEGTAERPVRIGAGLWLQAAVIEGQLDLAYLDVDGSIQFNGNRTGSCVIGKTGPVHCAGLTVLDSRFSGYTQILGFTAEAARPGDGRIVGPTDENGGSVTIQNCEFGSGLEFWRPERWEDGAKRNIGWTHACEVARIEGQLQIQGSRIAGNLVLSRVVVGTDEGDAPIGVIGLNGTTVTGAVLFESPISYLSRPGLSLGQQQAAEMLAGSPDARGFHAIGSVLFLPAQAETVDLSGLELRRAPGDHGWRGHVWGMGIAVTDRLQCYVERIGPGPPAQRAWDAATIPGALRLDFAKIGRLVVSARSFDNPRSDRTLSAADDGVVIEQATIGHLAIPRVKAEHGNGFPVPVDLSGVKVSRWTFEYDDDGAGGEKAEDALAADYLDVLDNDVRLHREVYRSVYRSLKDTGFDDAADRVYVAERYRATWESEGRWYKGDGRYITRFGRPPKLARNLHRIPSAPPLPAPAIARSRLGALLVRPFQWLRLGAKAGFDGLFFWFLRYGLSPLSLLIPIVSLAAISFLFVAPAVANFELSGTARLLVATGERPAAARGPIDAGSGISYRTTSQGTTPDPRDWGPWEWAWEVTRYHLPIVSVIARDDYQPTDDRPLALALPFRDPATGEPRVLVTTRLISAEDWFQAMLLLDWMLWPVLLTFLLRRVLRTE